MTAAPRKRRDAGVTLMELLIAVTLVALLATGMLLAVRVGFNAMAKANDRLMSNRRAASVEKIIEAEIAGIMPVKARCAASPENPPMIVPFFQGDPQSMRLVSNYSLQQASRGLPMILEFQVVPGEEDEGVRLIVNERIYTGPLATGAACAGVTRDLDTGLPVGVYTPVQVGPGSFVLADKLAYCRLSYRFLKQIPNQPPTALWLPHWPKPLLPNAIRIEMAPLKPDSAKAQLVTLTIPVHVTKDPMKDDYAY